MKALCGLFIAVALSGGVYAQSRGFNVQSRGFNPQPFVAGSFPNVVFPGGTASFPGFTRTFPNVVLPGGSGPRLVVPGSFSDPTRLSAGFIGRSRTSSAPRRSSRAGVAAVIPYPVYGGGGGYGGYGGYGGGYDTAPPPEEGVLEPPVSQQPNVIVIYANGPQAQPTVLQRPPSLPPVEPGAEPDTGSAEQPHYLIAFKDHTIYSAVAYWVDGDTLHYFTTGNTHNQVSLSLIDRDLTERLNRETGSNLRLPSK